MTTANIAQTLIETVAANPAAPARVSQVVSEVIAANSAAKAQVPRFWFDLIATTTVVRPPAYPTHREIAADRTDWMRGLAGSRAIPPAAYIMLWVNT